jgi:[ribosomal protein S5]-alanine N-acetyltransferase
MHFIKNSRVSFKSAEYVDIEQYSTWINHFDYMKYLSTTKFPKTVSELRLYLESFTNNPNKLFFSIFSQDDKYIGNISFSKIDWLNRTAELGIIIGDRSLSKKGQGKAAVALLCYYAFEQLGLQKICAGMTGENIGSIKLFEAVGFQKEGELREQFFINGHFISEYRYGLLKRELNNDLL